MSIVRQVYVKCDECGTWPPGWAYTVAGARLAAKFHGWKRWGQPGGKARDLCPACEKKRSAGKL